MTRIQESSNDSQFVAKQRFVSYSRIRVLQLNHLRAMNESMNEIPDEKLSHHACRAKEQGYEYGEPQLFILPTVPEHRTGLSAVRTS